MLADQLDYVVGVDPHRDSHALAIVDVRTGAIVFEANVAANSDGYRRALALGEEHAPGRRVYAVEGTGSFGAGLTRFLTGRGERVLEVVPVLFAQRTRLRDTTSVFGLQGSLLNCECALVPSGALVRVVPVLLVCDLIV